MKLADLIVKNVSLKDKGYLTNVFSAFYRYSPLELQKLDELYNISKVLDYRERLSDIDYLDNFYYYNKEV